MPSTKTWHFAVCLLPIVFLLRGYGVSSLHQTPLIATGTRRTQSISDRQRCRRVSSIAPMESDLGGIASTNRLERVPRSLLIHWKGSKVIPDAVSNQFLLLFGTRGQGGEKFSSEFGLCELKGALAAIMNIPFHDVSLDLVNALCYSGSPRVEQTPRNVDAFNHAMQYVVEPKYPRQAYIEAVERCSLVHAVYEVIAEGDTYDELARISLEQDILDDIKRGNENEQATWCVRVRNFGELSRPQQSMLRYGERTRSVSKEREVCMALKPVLIQFGGKVDLKQPNVKIYVFDGMSRSDSGHMALARRLAKGPQLSSIEPNTRICVTNTPLNPKAAFLLCNIACLRKDDTILDPFAGSGTVLLAAAMLEPTCRSVGIEIARDWLVDRNQIVQDFVTRNLRVPLGLLVGDCTHETVRQKARALIGSEPFDCLLTDPPYGIRESTMERDPLSCLIESIALDRENGTPLLKVGGTLVCYLPCQIDQDLLRDVLPSEELLSRARLRIGVFLEQPLNKMLSRWLVSFSCYG